MPQIGQHIVIVGGTAGLGYALTAACQAQGCTVTITGRNQQRAEDAAHTLGEGVQGIALDLTDQASITAALTSIERIDHLALVAIERHFNTIREYDSTAADRLVRVKLVGYAEVVYQAVPKLAPTASITLFGGVAALRPYPGSTMVSTANAGVTGLTTTLAKELAPIRVNTISPGVIGDTPTYEKRSPSVIKMLDDAAAQTYAKRLGTTAEIVHALLFLMDNEYIDGIDLIVDGGLHLP
jgi:NAD(P)-dependent dehydrogenase (short-subunit alcohol dehydrogenase family)